MASRRNPTESAMDILSSLNDEVLVEIISFLPIKDLMATSILSRRWRYLWRSATSLFFDDRQFPAPCLSPVFRVSYEVPLEGEYCLEFMAVVDRVLGLSTSRTLNNFSLRITAGCEFSRVVGWIDRAAQRDVKALQIVIQQEPFSFFNPFGFPSSIFNLKLMKQLHLSVEASKAICWPSHAPLVSLEDLHLHKVHFHPQTAKDAISTSCPRLKSWKMVACIGFRQMTVDSPELEVFHMESCRMFHHLLILGPRLKQLHMEASFFAKCRHDLSPAVMTFGIRAPNLKTFVWNDCPLVHHHMNSEMSADLNSFVQLEAIDGGERDLLLSLSRFGNLTMDCISILNCVIQERLLGSLYQNVHVLELMIDFNVLSSIIVCGALRCFPILETLRINTKLPAVRMFSDWSVVSETNECIQHQFLPLQQLLEVKFHGFRGSPSEMDIIKFIIKVATSLQSVKIKSAESSNMAFSSSASVVKKLSKIPSASSSLEFLVSEG